MEARILLERVRENKREDGREKGREMQG